MYKINQVGGIQISEDIRKKLQLSEGDFIEQQVIKDDIILLKKLEGDRLQQKALEKLSYLESQIQYFKKSKPDNELFSLLIELENLVETYCSSQPDSPIIEKVKSHSFDVPTHNEEKDYSILEIIYNGGNSLSVIAEKLNLPVSSISESLNNLYAQGLVDYYKESDGKRGRPKHVYYLTFFGEQYFTDNQ